MKTGTSLAKGLVVAVLLPLILAAGPATSQPPSATGAQAETLPQLLAEVRHLRQTVDQLAVVGIRVQIVLQRLSRRSSWFEAWAIRPVSSTRAPPAPLRRSNAWGRAGPGRGEVDQERRPNTRQALSDQRTTLKDMIEQTIGQEQDLRRRAAEAGQALALERSKLDELTQALDDLERSLALPGPRRPGNR